VRSVLSLSTSIDTFQKGLLPMKKRSVAPIKIFAVALGALGGAACSHGEPAAPANPQPIGTQAATVAVAPAPPATDTTPAPIAAPARAASPAAVAPPPPAQLAAPAQTARPEPPMDSRNPHINTLRAELARDEAALARLGHYRPLCDRDGYPLVGNIFQKAPTAHQPSEVCSAIRKTGAK
jgi:hypothetical protein